MASQVLFIQGQRAGNVNNRDFNNQTVSNEVYELQINPSRRGGNGGESSSDEKEFLESEEDDNGNLWKKEDKGEEQQSLEDFVLESFEIDELPQSDYNTLGLIRPEKVYLMYD